MSTIRVVLVDDHAVIRAGLKSLLESKAGIQVVGDTGDGRTAIQMVGELKPDIVVMDISMPELNGIEATRQIIAGPHKVKVICLSMHREKKFVDAILQAGATGYIVKDDAPAVLDNAIQIIASGGIYLSPSIERDGAASYVQGRNATSPRQGAKLTGREIEVLQLISEGYSTKEIATKLNLSEKTVAVHREHIMSKLDIHNVVDLARYAMREGLTPL